MHQLELTLEVSWVHAARHSEEKRRTDPSKAV